MPAARTFSKALVAEFNAAKILGVRAGLTPHRFLPVWVVVANGRVFACPWDNTPNGWRDGFLAEPRGTVQLPTREVAVRARTVRGERLLDAVNRAYAEKYPTKASQKYVQGFAQAKRRKNTMEFVPR